MSGEALRRLPAVLARLGASRSTVYCWITRGVFPPPVTLGPRLRAWPESELDSIVRARVAGRSDEELRRLVCELVGRRGRD